jgi:hypothetical protein
MTTETPRTMTTFLLKLFVEQYERWQLFHIDLMHKDRKKCSLNDLFREVIDDYIAKQETEKQIKVIGRKGKRELVAA